MKQKFYIKFQNETFRAAIDSTLASFSSLAEALSRVEEQSKSFQVGEMVQIFDQNYKVHYKAIMTNSNLLESVLVKEDYSRDSYFEKELWNDPRKLVSVDENILAGNFTDQYKALLVKNRLNKKTDSNQSCEVISIFSKK